MAIHPSFPSQDGPLSSQQARAISAWTEQAAASLENLTITESAPTSTTLRGATVSLSIPLDDPVPAADGTAPRIKTLCQSTAEKVQKVPAVTFRRREPLRRDSLKRREALLKGKDGSRRRQRWENDRLLHNPWAEMPSPKDWMPQPTHTRHEPMPYFLAPLWDSHYAHIERPAPAKPRHHIPKELRHKLKHARAARGMLQDLEEDVRQYIKQWQLVRKKDGLADASSSSDEDSEDEVVFVGRNGQKLQNMREPPSSHNQCQGEKMVFESSIDDPTAGFGRWLVHSIASYYGLHTWSVTIVGTARREAYVGFYPPSPRADLLSHSPSSCRGEVSFQPGEKLPQPLWKQV
ncbi:uncharacterized protein DSM5745_09006 [Aspergillus mulundensis]|uniref:R3H-associated N-terminal domain-containing protein n=1 Tax=Aspergillus mulundensis TaxID=1810919 RepID=A0A3D8QZP6_9EURO|nr:Uncharacterized protein DSM5745_09006 [Aspergillus mulundensis]RDW67140.1 Uncharacterized protein DSM5745_09006 [Aspergillus mulundensis]